MIGLGRRDFLRLAGAAAVQAAVASSLWARALRAAAAAEPSPYGPLLPADENDLMLPEGFRSRVVAMGGKEVGRNGYRWHRAPDGGAVFPVEADELPAGYVYVSNSERRRGGVGALRFDAEGRIVDAYPICSGTRRNCAGGATPWGTWLSCEEVTSGQVYECDPLGRLPEVRRPALGTFVHEAVAVDPEERRLYLTEDRRDGLLYRFTPERWEDLSSGLLEAARLRGGRVDWIQVPDPTPARWQTQTRRQLKEAARFHGGEGIVYSAGHVYFTTKGDHRVWDLHPAAGTLSLFYEAGSDPERQLTGGDNITASRSGDLFVAEDPGNLEIVLLTGPQTAAPFLRIVGHFGSEVTGPAFDPSGRRLYFSSQRGGLGMRGITYEVEGPFRTGTG